MSSQYPSPVKKVFLNHPSSKPFVKFISATLLDRLSTGAISLWGKVGEVQPPHLAMPLIVEPSKPRLCNDCFLNLWIADRPFQLDSLRDVVRYTPLDSFQTICDGKSGYDHIFVTPSGRTGFLLVILFLSGGNPLHTFTILIPRLFPHPVKISVLSVTQISPLLMWPLLFPTLWFHLVISLVCKSPFLSMQVPFLGFTSHSHLQAFTLLQSKKEKFLTLLKSILSSSQVELLTLLKLFKELQEAVQQNEANSHKINVEGINTPKGENRHKKRVKEI